LASAVLRSSFSFFCFILLVQCTNAPSGPERMRHLLRKKLIGRLLAGKGAAQLKVKVKQTRRVTADEDRPDPRSSQWFKSYVLDKHEEYRDPSTTKGQEFRRRFRVPWECFHDMVTECEALPAFARWRRGKTDAVGRPCTPMALLVLGCLRILGRGVVFDDIADYINCNECTVRDFFFVFIQHWSTIKYRQHVRLPADEEEMEEHEHDYALGGLNGCIGSADCCHMSWDRCNATLAVMAKGKSGFTTIAFQLVVNHRRRILHSSDGFLGSTNDKAIARIDSFMADLHAGRNKLAAKFQFDLFCADGQAVRHTGAYILTDNGYHRWRVLQPPVLHPSNDEVSAWSENVESFRKDVGALYSLDLGQFRFCELINIFPLAPLPIPECVFGVMKQRWRILKTGIRLQNAAAMSNNCTCGKNPFAHFQNESGSCENKPIRLRDELDLELLEDELLEDELAPRARAPTPSA
jgi:hypothetical protein